jgi:V-type H+-transporting ATPase proteolipid subunit
MRNIIPVVMAGVLGIYGLIVAVIIQGSIQSPGNIVIFIDIFIYIF